MPPKRGAFSCLKSMRRSYCVNRVGAYSAAIKKSELRAFEIWSFRLDSPSTSQLHHHVAMLAARRLQNGCPSCTAQILKLYANTFAEISPAAATAARTTRRFTPRARISSRRSDARFLSTSSRRLKDGTTEHAQNNVRPGQIPDELALPPENELLPGEELLEAAEDEVADDVLDPPAGTDPETVVRQAKRMFGDTLPPDYLSTEEYALYVRLYGAPLRTTRPEDVGFGSFGEAEEEAARNAATTKTLLLREDQEGNLEEVEYTMEQLRAMEVSEDGEVVSVEEEHGKMEPRPPSEAQIEFIEANASNEREYDALLQLQKDFEAARIRAVQQEAEELAAREEEEGQDEIEEEEEDVTKDEEETEPDALSAWYPDHEGPRLHEYTMEGRFSTSPKTLFLPKDDFIEPITEMLKRTDTKHVRLAAEKSCGGPGLPHSPATPRFARNMQQKGLGLEAVESKLSEIDADAFMATALPGIYASVMSALVEVRKRLGPEWIKGMLSRKDDDGVGPRVLDAGAGGAGLSAWQNVLQAEWDVMRENGEDLDATPPGKRTVIVGSNQLRHRISRFLENTQFLPRLPNYAAVDNSDKQLDAPEVPQKRKVYDVIIATHMLVPLEREWRRKEVLDNLWQMLSPEGGVLIVLEKGHPRGFEAVADVRQRLLDEYILPPVSQPRQEVTEPDKELRVREPGMIVAPCTNHSKCPMYLTPGIRPGRKDFCHFSQRFVRPPFLQRVLGATHRNHEDINFSFVAIRRGMPAAPAADVNAEPTASEAQSEQFISAPTPILQGEHATRAALAGYESVPSTSPSRPHPLSLPRNILRPLKRKGHVTFDLCTPSGSIERWTVPKSFSKQAYHDARKAKWGDLWALGAKTRVRRAVRLGRGVKEGEAVPNDGGVRAARAQALSGFDAKGRKVKKGKLRVVDVSMNETGSFAARVRGVQGKRPERRTKGGRKPPSQRNLLRLDED